MTTMKMKLLSVINAITNFNLITIMAQKKFPFTMGADPEFSFILQGRRVNARELIYNSMRTDNKFKEVSEGYQVAKAGAIGWDGCNATAELRPSPIKTPEEMVKNIREIIEATSKKLPLFDISILSLQAPVGGHIHFELPINLHDNHKGCTLIHKKVSSFFLPILMSENKINLRIRCKGNYGDYSDFHDENRFRGADGKTVMTYEFRTPSAEWLTTPKITEATFAYLGTIYHEIINNPDNFKKYINLVYKNNEQASALHSLALSDYMGITAAMFSKIKKAIKTFEYYKHYKDQIDYILNPAKVYNDKKNAQYNMVIGWNLRKGIKNPTVKDLINKKKFKEKISKINLDKISPMVNVSYNDDTNVALFAKDLSEKCLAFNWQLTKAYFLFGLKKGVKDFIIFDDKRNMYSGEGSIKTVLDQKAVKELMDRIIGKYRVTQPSKNINPITGEINPVSFYAIGLPYDIRLEKNTDPMIKNIFALEKSKLNASILDVNNKNIIDDSTNKELKGEIAKAYFPEAEDEMTNPTIDTDSQGYHKSRDAISEILREEENDERNNQEEPTLPSIQDQARELLRTWYSSHVRPMGVTEIRDSEMICILDTLHRGGVPRAPQELIEEIRRQERENRTSAIIGAGFTTNNAIRLYDTGASDFDN